MFSSQNSQVSSAANFIEDVFSTYLYTGNGSTQTITNGIDLAGKDGMVWCKSRSSAIDHFLADSVRGSNKLLYPNLTYAQQTDANVFTAFNSNGFSLGVGGAVPSNNNGVTYASWTFREQPKFFDVVTYTGTGGGPSSVAHALGSVPGFLIIKSTSRAGNWICVARRSNGNYALFTTNAGLNLTSAANQPDNANVISSGALSATTFDPSWFNSSGAVGNVDNICDNGVTYVAYLFAHDAGGFGLTGTDNVISCGSFTTDGSGAAGNITLGYESQWVLVKRADGVGSWFIVDTMRGSSLSSYNYISANTANAENAQTSTQGIYPTATGFYVGNNLPAASATYIYIAIRRGPMKTPTTGTSVYNAIARTGTGSADNITGVGFPPDFVMAGDRTAGGGNGSVLWDRLRGSSQFNWSASAAGEQNYPSSITSFNMNGISVGTDSGFAINRNTLTYINWFMRRASGFFDVVCYTGTGVARTINHNLGVAPELIIVKSRSNSGTSWPVYSKSLTVNQYIVLNTSGSFGTFNLWNATAPTSSVFSVSTYFWVNEPAYTYVAYLFATLAGVSKVGSYNGSTGNVVTVPCGFAAGARFVLIKRTDSTGDWYVWDSARGITSGNDPYLTLNTTAAEVTGTNYVDTDPTGFKVTAAAPAELNASGGTYIFLAIA